MKINFTMIVIATIPLNAAAQVGMESGNWKPTPDAEHHKAVCQVIAGDGMAAGVIIGVDSAKAVAAGHEGWALTAWHVVKNQTDIRVRYFDGQKGRKCKVLGSDEKADVALLWVWVPDSVPAATIAGEAAAEGNVLEFTGLGGGTKITDGIRHFRSVASGPTRPNIIHADTSLLAGDSGGGVFKGGRLVGIISGGWFWYSSDRVKTSPTWPARACGRKPIAELIAPKLGPHKRH